MIFFNITLSEHIVPDPCVLLAAGVGLCIAAFCVEPVGQIHDSVLWYFAQCLIYAGSAIGIDVIIDERIKRGGKT